MYINRGLLKQNAKNTLSRGYWSCVLTGLVLAFATGALGDIPSTKNYSFKNTSDPANSFFGGQIQKNYDPGAFLGDYFSNFDFPTYMIGPFISIMVIVIVISVLIAIFLMQPLEVGCRRFYVRARENDYDLSAIVVAAFSENYMNVVKVMFLRSLYTFLWSMLFIIPGIIKSYEYRMIPYILAENPGISEHDAFSESRRMMTGSKFDAFVFDLSFLGWFLLDAITFGLAGIFYVNPYYFNACTELYAFVKAKPGYAGNHASRAYDYGSGYQSGGYQSSGYQNGGYQNSGYQAADNTDAADQTYGRPADNVPGPGLPDTGGTVSADDAKPFNTPYGQ